VLNSIVCLATAALAVFVAALMLVATATTHPLTASASPTAEVSAIVSATDVIFGQRAMTVSRSLGTGRESRSTTESASAPAATATPAPPPTPTVDDARALAFARLGAAQFSCLDALWRHESDWDPFAQNPISGAYGIAQALPAGKMASTGADWKSNPTTQVKWGLEYIAARYGSPCNAWSFWLRQFPHWY